MASKMLSGSPILLGDNTIPGVRIPKEVQDQLPTVFKACRDFGLDFYPTVVEFLTYDEISEVAAYGGFPVRYPHWQFGMEYEELAKGYEHGMHRIYEMVINCQVLGTMVLTDRGTIPAEDVRPGDKCFISNDSRDVVAVVRQPRSPTVNVRLKQFGRTLGCTPHHRWRVLGSQGLEWKKAEELQKGDLLVGSDNFGIYQNSACQITWTDDKVVEETRPNIRHRVKKIRCPDQMCTHLAELLGIVVGDGSVGVTNDRNYIRVVFNKADRIHADRVVSLFESLFAVEATLVEKPSCLVVVVCSKALVDLFDWLGLKKGSTHDTKRIPWSIWASSMEFRAAFLRGLFDTDGSSLGGWFSFSSKNPDLAYDVQVMLLEMGIKSKVSTRRNGAVGCNEITVLTVRGFHNLSLVEHRIGFTIDRKVEGLRQLVEHSSQSGTLGETCPAYIANQVRSWLVNLGFNEKNLRGCFWVESPTREAVWSAIGRAEHLRPHASLPDELLDLLNMPCYSVEAVEDGPEVETIDIALDHDAHDYTANGLATHNTNPCYIYCLDSNTLVDNITVVAHALGHNDFFKNNVYFGATNTNMLNKMANHGTRIRNYIARWGKEKVVTFIDHILRLQTLIDPYDAWNKKEYQAPTLVDQRNYRYPSRTEIPADRNYMEPWINTQERMQKERKRIEREEMAEEIGVFGQSTKNILGWLKDNAPLKPWQQDICSMLYEEAMYFAPQRMTKMANEGWASFTDYKIMAEMGFVSLGQEGHDMGIVEYAAHKMGVLGGKYSMNPYKLGFKLFLDIEERWNKGRFGEEYDNCEDQKQKENWDTGTMLGHEKVFEVRRCYNDMMMIHEFFTDEFCRKNEFFEWKLYPNGEYRIENNDPVAIRKKLIQRYSNGGLPDIRLTDADHLGRGWLCLEHKWEGRALFDSYVRHTLASLHVIWKNVVVLSTKDNDENEYVYICESENPKEVMLVTRNEYEKRVLNVSDKFPPTKDS